MLSAITNVRSPFAERTADNYNIVIKDNIIINNLCGDGEIPVGAKIFDLAGGWLLPGFIDLQVNGGDGVLFNNDPTPDGLAQIIAAHRRLGTAGLLATVITHDAEIRRAAAAAVAAQLVAGLPGLLGIHFEGPFLNPAKAGVHDPRHMRRPTAAALADLMDDAAPVLAAGGKVLATLAPELFDPADLRRLADSGVRLAAGHSAATYDEAMRGFAAGVAGVTHLFNAMTGLESRAPGLVGAALDSPNVWCGVIADEIHVHPAALRLAARLKGPDRLALVSDAMATVGLPANAPRAFQLYGQTIRAQDGRLVDSQGRFAGADLALADAVCNMAPHVGAAAAERMAAAAPAAALGLATATGLAAGMAADLTWLDDDLRPCGVWSAGNFCACGALPLA
mgnify:CR=1 FL=1